MNHLVYSAQCGPVSRSSSLHRLCSSWTVLLGAVQQYCSKILFARKRGADHKPVYTLPEKHRGRSLLISQELEDKVKWFLTELRKSGGVVNLQVTISTAKGVVKSRDSNLLVENGGSIDISRDWAHRLLGRMGLVKRQATTKAAKVSPVTFAGIKAQY